MSTCKYCSKSHVSKTAYEDGIYQIIQKWLCDHTCIKWYRLPLEVARPKKITGSGQKQDAQYGTIHISPHQINTKGYKHKIEEFNNDFCARVEKSKTVTIELVVYREAGQELHCQNEDDDYNRSPVDILEQVNDLISFEEITQPLSDENVKLHKTDDIQTGYEERKSSWEQFASSSFDANVCYSASYLLDPDKLVYCVEDCDGEPLCLEK